jgi:hypothetical protein
LTMTRPSTRSASMLPILPRQSPLATCSKRNRPDTCGMQGRAWMRRDEYETRVQVKSSTRPRRIQADPAAQPVRRGLMSSSCALVSRYWRPSSWTLSVGEERKRGVPSDHPCGSLAPRCAAR